MNLSEHEFEPVRGLPEPLPPGEHLLWQGTPDWRVLAIDALHVRKVAVYFVALIAWRIGASLHDGAGIGAAFSGATWLTVLGLLAVALLCGCAIVMARSSVYSITDRRVVMRVGVALSVTFNLPFKLVDSASLHERSGGFGDVALALQGEDRIAYLHLWPHARPWQIRRTQPMLRAIPQARHVAQVLGEALLAYAKANPATDAAKAAAPQAPTPAMASPRQQPSASAAGSRPMAHA